MKKLILLILSLTSISTYAGDVDPYSQEVLIFHNSVLSGDFKKFENMLNEGMDIDQRRGAVDTTPLLAAARLNQWDTVKYLLDKGANHRLVDAYEKTVLEMAIAHDQEKIIKLINSLN